jgi:hypothetical protein
MTKLAERKTSGANYLSGIVLNSHVSVRSEGTTRDEGEQSTILPKCLYLWRYLIFAGNVSVKKSN